MNISKGLRNSVTELLALCDEQINRWKLTREQLSMLTNGHNGHVPQMVAMAEVAAAVHKTRRKPRVHWTQTPAGRRKMSAHMKRRNAEKLAAEKAAK